VGSTLAIGVGTLAISVDTTLAIRLLIVTVGPTVAAEVRRAVSQASAGQVQVVLQGAVQLWVDMVAVASSAELRQPPCPGWPRPQLRMLSLNCCPNQAKT
jgi:hypothetical protein